MPNDSKQLSYLKRNAARSKDIFLLAPNHVFAATHDLLFFAQIYTYIATFSINLSTRLRYDTKAFAKTYPLILNSTQAFAQGVGYVKALLLKG